MTLRRFHLALFSLIGAWLALAGAYAVRMPFVADEVQGAHTSARLLEAIPYRDFTPYKTVLGYYVQLFPLGVVGDPWSALVATRLEMVLLGAGVLLLAGVTLARFRGRPAVLLGLLLLLVSSGFAARAGELRVDMLTAWVGLLGLLALVRGRWLLAGVITALSFFVSQKGAYFALAGGAGIVSVWPLIGRREGVRAALRYAVGGTLVALAYFGLWAVAAPVSEVLRATFVNPAPLALGDVFRDLPAEARWGFWGSEILAAPILYLAAVVAVLRGAWEGWRIRRGRGEALAARFGAPAAPVEGEAPPSPRLDRILLAGYGATLLLLYLSSKQPWPYFLATLAPTLSLLAIDLVDAEWGRHTRSRGWRTAAVALLFVGLFPLAALPRELGWSNAHQANTVRRMAVLLEPGDAYLAGVNILPRGQQAPAALTWIDRAASARLAAMTDEEVQALDSELRGARIKLFVHTEQISRLPLPLQETLLASFLPYEGYLYLYAPSIGPGAEAFSLSFGGPYLLEAPAGAEVSIDGSRVPPGGVLSLEVGAHRSESSSTYRLRYLPSSAPVGPQGRPPLPFFSRSMAGGLTTWADEPAGG